MSDNDFTVEASSFSGDTKADAGTRTASVPDPKTVEMIRYYRQAHRDHGFRLIEVDRSSS